MLSPDMLSKCSLTWYGLKVRNRYRDVFWTATRGITGDSGFAFALEGELGSAALVPGIAEPCLAVTLLDVDRRSIFSVRVVVAGGVWLGRSPLMSFAEDTADATP